MLKKIVSAIIACSIVISAMSGMVAYGDGSGIYIPGQEEPMFTGSASQHMLLLSYGGTVSAWGNNTNGQCGIETPDYISEPNYIEFDTDAQIIQVSAGGNFSLALDSDGNVWAWGDNTYKQLGFSYPTDVNTKKYEITPRKIER